MLRILMLPFMLVFGLVFAIVQLPFSLFASRKIMKIEEQSKKDIDDMASKLHQELGKIVCKPCLTNGNLRCTPAPERKITTQDSKCLYCGGTGVL